MLYRIVLALISSSTYVSAYVHKATPECCDFSVNAVACIGGLLPAVYSLFVIDVSGWLLARALSILIRAFDCDVL